MRIRGNTGIQYRELYVLHISMYVILLFKSEYVCEYIDSDEYRTEQNIIFTVIIRVLKTFNFESS